MDHRTCTDQLENIRVGWRTEEEEEEQKQKRKCSGSIVHLHSTSQSQNRLQFYRNASPSKDIK